MRITALEGPSFAGKTSALTALRLRLSAMTVVAYGCYVDEITDDDDIPPARTRSAAEQLKAFELFMQIEAMRVADLQRQAVSADVVLLDRSVDTLLAHAYALDRLYDFGVHNEARLRLAEMPYLCPDHTFYLDASPETLNRRWRCTQEPFDSFLLDPEFIRHFRDYFTKKGLPVSADVSIVPAEQGQSIVAERIARRLLQERRR